MSRLISDGHVEAALKYLSENTWEAAKARGDRVQAENDVDHEFSRLFLASPDGSVESKKAWVKTQPTYVAACKAHVEALTREEYHKRALVKAEMLIEMWRSESASIRAAEKLR